MELAVTHGIVTDYGGTIEVQSQPGQGTTFILYFPRTTESLQEGVTTSSHTSPGQGHNHVH
jgi:signal transduction histidine kinase